MVVTDSFHIDASVLGEGAARVPRGHVDSVVDYGLGRHPDVALFVPGLTCAACPITVKRALTQVDGVTEVEVSFERREAVVTFDDDKTDVRVLTRATENVGYPSSLAKSAA